MTTELARIAPPAVALSRASDDRHALQPQTFAEALQLARAVAGTPFAPGMTPEGALAAMMSGRELGLTAMQSLRAFCIVKGKPTLWADSMVAVVRASGLCDSWETIESTPTTCTIATRRKGSKRDQTRTWTADDARRAKLGGDTWASYPAQMLRHRCASDLARDVYPDVLLGIYAREEIESDTAQRTAYDTAQPAHVEAEAADAPQGSRAWAVYVDRIGHADSLKGIHTLYADLLAGLHEESVEPTCYTEDSDGHPGAYTLAVQRVAALGHHLAASERTALLGVNGAALARWIDTSALVIDTDALRDRTVTAAAWWLTHKGDMGRAEAGIVYMTMARRLAADGTDVGQVKAAKAALTAEVTRQSTPPTEPPTGTDAPPSQRPANGSAQSTARAVAPVDAAAAQASRERVASKGGVESYLASKGSRRELEMAVRAHGRYVEGLLPAAVDRLDALSPADQHGTRPHPSTLRHEVAAWSAEGPTRQESKAA